MDRATCCVSLDEGTRIRRRCQTSEVLGKSDPCDPVSAIFFGKIVGKVPIVDDEQAGFKQHVINQTLQFENSSNMV